MQRESSQLSHMYNRDIVFNQLHSMNSFKAIAEILYGYTLKDVQCIDVMRALLEQRSIFVYETGTGKTLIAAALMRLLKNYKPDSKFIFVCKKDQLIQTPKKFEDSLHFKVACTTAEQKSVRKIVNAPLDYDILMITHDCLRNQPLLQWLRRNSSQFFALFIDEAHELNNFSGADNASVLSKVSYGFEYCYALTATPITTDPMQLANLLSIVDPYTFKNTKALYHALVSHPDYLKQYPGKVIVRDRSDFGVSVNYRGIIRWAEMSFDQTLKLKAMNNTFLALKGPGATNQVEALIDEVQSRGRGLVYINQHAVREWVTVNFDKVGIKYACINGMTKSSEREEILRQFNEDKSIDVIITSVTTAIDMDSDYVIFYEFTVDCKQMIGRVNRGFRDRTIDIIYIITKSSPEIDYFLNNIYARSEIVKELLGQDNSELLQIASRI